MAIKRTPEQLNDFLCAMAESDYKNNHWLSKAKSLIGVLTTILTSKYGSESRRFDASIIRETTSIYNLIDIASNSQTPSNVSIAVSSYLNSLNGFNLNQGHSQHSGTFEEHLYLSMALTTALSQIELEIQQQSA